MILINFFKKIDFILFFLALAISFLGLTILYPATDLSSNFFFNKQIFSLSISIIIFLITSQLDIYFLKNSRFITFLYFFSILLLSLLTFLGTSAGGAQSWFSFGLFAFQPTDLVKFILVLVLAKFFFKRHVEIKSYKHLFVSGFYALIPFILLALQPDFGSAIIIFFIWLGMTLLSGLPKKMLLIFFIFLFLIIIILYNFAFADYQKKRIITFFNPDTDSLGAGYNITQSKIAIGNGGYLGTGLGEGTQSRLSFLPEYETDFIFAAYAEEWGLTGVLFLFLLYLLIIIRIIQTALKGRTNFETLLAGGILVYFITHFVIHIGINLGLLPVTGTTLPFMSYGGSHLIIEFLALGIINAINKTNKNFNRHALQHHDIL